MKTPLHVHSEIGRLKKVLLHRPSVEIENMTPQTMHELLFDDIPYAEVAMKEHDAFADTLRKEGVEVLYVADLLAESLTDEKAKDAFIRQYVEEATCHSPARAENLTAFLQAEKDLSKLAEHVIAGTRTEVFPPIHRQTLTDYVENSTIVAQPMPNMYFTRDPLTIIGHGVNLHKMYTTVRNRESLLIEQIFTHHPVYGNPEIPHWYNRQVPYSLEGGDILVLSKDTIAVGISQRTEPRAIERLAETLLGEESGYQKIIAVDIPKIRAFMHLDTVLTQIDYDAFTIHPEIEPTLRLFSLTKNERGEIQIHEEEDSLAEVFAKVLGQDKVTLIPCAGGHPIHAPREQWNDGSNTLCVAPGTCVVYTRNYVTNDLLDKHGIRLLEIESSELSRGRGGPRCMSMPFVREDL